MVTITCPWCEDDAPLAFAWLEQPETPFTCADCGTTVIIVDDAATKLDIAA